MDIFAPADIEVTQGHTRHDERGDIPKEFNEPWAGGNKAHVHITQQFSFRECEQIIIHVRRFNGKSWSSYAARPLTC